MSSRSHNNVSATTQPFGLTAGQWGATAHAGAWGTATLQILAGDGATWLNTPVALTADGVSQVNLMSGQYRWNLAGVTGAYLVLSPINPPP